MNGRMERGNMSSSDDRGPLVLTPDMIQQRVRLVDVADLEQWDSPYQADVGAALMFLGTFGQFQLPVVAGGEVIYGQEFVAAEVAGEQFGGQVAVLDVTDLEWPREKVLAAVLGLHNLERQASIDAEQLLALLQEVQKTDESWLAGAGYDPEDMDAIYEQLQRDQEALDAMAGEGQAGEAEDADKLDKVPESAPARTKPGDVWLLGSHRIMCGDCRDADHVARLLDGAAINLAFTSPPYASQRKYDESSGFKPIHPDEYVEWFEAVQSRVATHLADDGSWFVNIKEHCDDGQRVLYVKDLTLTHARTWGWAFVDEFAWVRSGVPGKWGNRFKNGWEPIFHYSRGVGHIKFNPEAVGHESDDVLRYSPDNTKTHSGFLSSGENGRIHGIALPSNVLHISAAHADPDRGHTAEFPVGLPAWFCKAYTDPGDVVYDPFMGSGSTLIAAHSEGRVGYGMEISAKYVDIICARWQRLTGEKPILASTGDAHDFVDG